MRNIFANSINLIIVFLIIKINQIMKNYNLSDAQTLEVYRIGLENAERQDVIANVLAELGYDSQTIGEGKQLWSFTREVYENNDKEEDETVSAYVNFSQSFEELEDLFKVHRKKAKVVFRKSPDILQRLAVSGAYPSSYIKKMESIKKFYNTLFADVPLLNAMSKLKVTDAEVQQAKVLITTVETNRGEYLKEKGESQDATMKKDMAFAKLDEWMQEFYAVAKIGLEDQPQLLEALGKVVK